MDAANRAGWDGPDLMEGRARMRMQNDACACGHACVRNWAWPRVCLHPRFRVHSRARAPPGATAGGGCRTSIGPSSGPGPGTGPPDTSPRPSTKRHARTHRDTRAQACEHAHTHTRAIGWEAELVLRSGSANNAERVDGPNQWHSLHTIIYIISRSRALQGMRLVT